MLVVVDWTAEEQLVDSWWKEVVAMELLLVNLIVVE